MSLHCIKQLIHRKKIGNVCTFGKNTTIDSKTYFEGMNRLGENTWFLNSSIGYASYISNNSFIKNTVIGRYTCIANDVMTVAGNFFCFNTPSLLFPCSKAILCKAV